MATLVFLKAPGYLIRAVKYLGVNNKQASYNNAFFFETFAGKKEVLMLECAPRSTSEEEEEKEKEEWAARPPCSMSHGLERP